MFDVDDGGQEESKGGGRQESEGFLPPPHTKPKRIQTTIMPNSLATSISVPDIVSDDAHNMHLSVVRDGECTSKASRTIM